MNMKNGEMGEGNKRNGHGENKRNCFAIIIFSLWIDLFFILFYFILYSVCSFFYLIFCTLHFFSLSSFSFTHSQNVLAIGDAKWENFGYPRWELVVCLMFGWIVAFLCLSKGIKSAGKTVFFVVIFPYVILTILLVSNWVFFIGEKSIVFNEKKNTFHSN